MVSASPMIALVGIRKFFATLPMLSAISSGTASKAVAIIATVRVYAISSLRGTSMRAPAVTISAIAVVGIGSSSPRRLISRAMS
ncbi:hypothetical protein D9M70_360710 [compost metagenome]